MIIHYCPNCAGKPYTTDWNLSRCPRDGSLLERMSVDPSELVGRPCLDAEVSPADESGEDVFTFAEEDREDVFLEPENDRGDAVSPQTESAGIPASVGHFFSGMAGRMESGAGRTSSGNRTVLTGRVTNYSRSSLQDTGYRRSWISKLWQALRYGQRTTDVLHRFTLHSDHGGGASDLGSNGVVVNVHGVIATGASINENEIVEVEGDYSPRTGVLFARRIVVNAGGRNARVRFQHDAGSIVRVLLVLAAVVGALALWQSDSPSIDSVLTVLVIGGAIALLVWLLRNRPIGVLLLSGCLGRITGTLLIAGLVLLCLLVPSIGAGILMIAIPLFGIWLLTRSLGLF